MAQPHHTGCIFVKSCNQLNSKPLGCSPSLCSLPPPSLSHPVPPLLMGAKVILARQTLDCLLRFITWLFHRWILGVCETLHMPGCTCLCLGCMHVEETLSEGEWAKQTWGAHHLSSFHAGCAYVFTPTDHTTQAQNVPLPRIPLFPQRETFLFPKGRFIFPYPVVLTALLY